MSAALKSAHYCAIAHPVNFDQARALELARAALAEFDALQCEVIELRKAVKQAPRFQGMTELA